LSAYLLRLVLATRPARKIKKPIAKRGVLGEAFTRFEQEKRIMRIPRHENNHSELKKIIVPR